MIIPTGKQLLAELNSIQQIAYAEKPRAYLGMSSLGYGCIRQIWYQWRWIFFEELSPRKMRLFRRGHREESAVVDYLRLMSFKVWPVDPKTNEQWEFTSSDSHCKGHCDSIAQRHKVLYMCEMKTHATKYFRQVIKTNDISISMPSHYVQLQRYTGEAGLKYGIYIATNKEDDALHFEVHKFDKKAFNASKETERVVLSSDMPPLRVSNNPSFYICNMCNYRDVCHYGATPIMTCRSCKKLGMAKNGIWACRKDPKNPKVLNTINQLKACQDHTLISGL